MSMDENRVKYKLRRAGTRILVDIWFDECQLGSSIVVSGDERIALMVESGELRLTKDSNLVYEDGTPYHIASEPITQRDCKRL